MAKFKISTIEVKGNVQVIALDANFVTRTTKASCRVEELLSQTSYKDENGYIHANLNGMKQIFTDEICADSFISLLGTVYDFLRDMTDAFEEEIKPAP